MMDRTDKLMIRRMILILLELIVLLCCVSGVTLAVDGEPYSFTVSIDVEYGQTAARKMLSQVNSFRTGNEAYYIGPDNKTIVQVPNLGKLTYSQSLEKVAMLRAAEIALRYDHLRPNQTYFVDELDDYTYAGENIVAFTRRATPQEAFDKWKEDNKSYSEQGHRRSMLGKYYTSVGIGHVNYKGYDYWVQIFGTAQDGAGTAFDGNKTVTIKVNYLAINSVANYSKSPSSITMKEGETQNVPTVTADIKFVSGLTTNRLAIPGKWTSADPSVVQIENNRLTGLAVGSTTVSTTIYGTKISVPVTVKASQSSVTAMVRIRNSGGTDITGKLVEEWEDSIQLKAAAIPSKASQKFTWKSSNTSVAAVDQNGKVTFKKDGMVTITATATDGSKKSASVKFVYVAPPEILDTNIEGFMNEIRIKATFMKNTDGYIVRVYDLNDNEINNVYVDKETNADQTYQIFHITGSGLKNETIYKILIYRYRFFNGEDYSSKEITKYGMPSLFVRGLTAAPGNESVTLNSQPLSGTEGTRYQIRDAQTSASVGFKLITGSNKAWTLTGLENGHRYYVTARAYNRYNGHYVYGALLYKTYFIPLSTPAKPTITFTSSTYMKVSIPEDEAADGIRVLYRTPGGALQNGCESKGTQCVIKGMSKTGKYELYVMKYKTSPSGYKHYSRGRLALYNTTSSGLSAPANPLVVVYGDTYTFKITKSSDAKGISVLYREGTGDFKPACEKASASCQADLSGTGKYSFYIMQYKLNSAGKKVYSPGVTARTRFSTKSPDETEYYLEEAADFDADELYGVLEDYSTEADELMTEAYEVMGVDPLGDTEIEEISAEESLLDLEEQEDFDGEYDMYVPEDEWDLEDPEDFDEGYETDLSDNDRDLEDPEDTDWGELILEGLEDETAEKSVGSASGKPADPISFYRLEDGKPADPIVPSFGN